MQLCYKTLHHLQYFFDLCTYANYNFAKTHENHIKSVKKSKKSLENLPLIVYDISIGIKVQISEVKMKLNITDVRVRLVKDGGGKLKAIASITIDECFVVHDIKIIEGNDSPFIAMPSRKTQEGEYKDVAHPILTSTREELSKLVLDAYAKAVEIG